MSVISKTRIIFMGTPPFAAQILAALNAVENLEILAVYCQPPRPANRGKKITKSAVHTLAETLGLDVFHPSNFKSDTDVEQLKALNADVAVVAAYGLILPTSILNAPKLHCVNIHPSLLPRWRGAAPIQRAIEAGDTHTGVCLMQMNQGLDTGDIICERRMTIAPEQDALDLHDALADMGARMIIELLTAYPNGGWPTNPQPSTGVTYALKIDKAEARLDWQQPADTLARKVKAFLPFPGVFFELPNSQERIKVLEAHATVSVSDQNRSHASPAIPVSHPGTIAGNDATLDVFCANGSILSVLRAQRAGKMAMPMADLLCGLELKVGENLVTGKYEHDAL